jgi:hypothetical protein
VGKTQRQRKAKRDRALAKTAQVVRDRDGYRCCAESKHCTGGLTTQHRLNRGMGGSGQVDGPEWLVAMCWGHNTRCESDAAFAQIARDSGWKLTRGEDPTEVAVFFRGVGWRLLDTEGGRHRCAPARDKEDREHPTDGPLAEWRGLT